MRPAHWLGPLEQKTPTGVELRLADIDMARQRKTDGRDNPNKKRKNGKPEDPIYPVFPDVPPEQQPPAGVNQMFNPTPQNPATRSVGSRNKMSLGQQLVSAISDPSMQARNNLPPHYGYGRPRTPTGTRPATDTFPHSSRAGVYAARYP